MTKQPEWTTYHQQIEITIGPGGMFNANVSGPLSAPSLAEIQGKIENAVRHKNRQAQQKACVPVVVVCGDRVLARQYRGVSARDGGLLMFEGLRGKKKTALDTTNCIAMLAPKSPEATTAKRLAAKVESLTKQLATTRDDIAKLCEDHALKLRTGSYYGAGSFGHKAAADRHETVLAHLADLGLYEGGA